ncbi:MAG TPA: T9SS type A sorting domain-containing protein, partial [Flavobacteriales bacterium]
WNLLTNEAVDREPLTADWDLLFTRYMSNVMGTMYAVAGVLQNKTVEVAQLDAVDPSAAVAADAAGFYSADMNIIGSDWKSYNIDAGAYEYVEDRAYFVRAVDGAVWKLIFTAYGGGATGAMTFTKELMSATDIADAAANGTAVVYPNPVSGATVNLLLDVPSSNVMMEVYDLTGKRLMNRNVTGLSAMSVRTLDISALTPGAYVVRFVHGKGIATTKLIVE